MTGDEWLKDFFQIVDDNRLERGKALYHSEKLTEFDIDEEKNKFYAHVQGSRSQPYKVEGYFPVSADGSPDIDDLFVECTCPDWVEFCKHAVCAVIHYSHELDRNWEKFLAAKEQLSERVNELKKLITSDMVSITTLEDASFFESDRGLKNMHSIVRHNLHRLG